ncbi:MAG: hypothetical protein H0T62_05785 [Parachlamydiaceae bacterium]|nr:hypothetical protein [Parachlamydiaceae bacterium]
MNPDYSLNFNVKFCETASQNKLLKKQQNDLDCDFKKIITYTDLVSVEVLSLTGNKEGEKNKQFHCYAWPTEHECFLSKEYRSRFPINADTEKLNWLLNRKIEKKCGEAGVFQPLLFQSDSHLYIQSFVDALKRDGYSIAVERNWVSAYAEKHIEYEKIDKKIG